MVEAVIISITLFAALTVVFSVAIRKIGDKKNDRINPDEKNISIIIAARNEEENLDNLFLSLEQQNYPKDKFEIVFVDDNSTDETFAVAQKYTDRFIHFRLLKAEHKNLPAKKGALEIGIAEAQFPFLLFTDADCMPESNWLKAFSNKFATNFDLLLGFAPLTFQKTFANHFFCFENFRTTILSFTVAKLGMPYSAASRSLGITKEAFRKLGGFSKTLQTLGGDDDLLIREAVKSKCKIGIVSEAESLVFSNTAKNFAGYFMQKRRHTATSFHYLWQHQLLLGFWHLLNILAVDSLFLIPFLPEAGYLFLSKIFCDYFIIYSFQKRFKYKFSFGEIFFFQILYECFLVVHFFNTKFFKIKWK
ncbi:MAG: glycosyltransferase [Ignavibacteriaceae bacterium]